MDTHSAVDNFWELELMNVELWVKVIIVIALIAGALFRQLNDKDANGLWWALTIIGIYGVMYGQWR